MPQSEAFAEAVATAGALPAPPSDVRIKLYSLFKQAEFGDAPSTQPSAFDVVARAKWDAWNGMRGMSREEAESQYCDLVAQLSGGGGGGEPPPARAGASSPAYSGEMSPPPQGVSQGIDARAPLGWLVSLVRAACCLAREHEEAPLLGGEPTKDKELAKVPTAGGVVDDGPPPPP